MCFACRYRAHDSVGPSPELQRTMVKLSQPFGSICDLIPQAERVDKLCAVCVVCGKDAAFTRRLCDSQVVELVGGAETYIPACRACFQLSKERIDEVLGTKQQIASSETATDEPTASAGSCSPSACSPAINPATKFTADVDLSSVQRELIPAQG